MSKRTTRLNITQRGLLLAFAYAIFWAVVHYAATRADLRPGLLVLQLASSTLMFFTLNAFFLTFNPYRRGGIFQFAVAFFYVQPFFQLFYYLTYKSFLDQQNFSLVIREPSFLAKVFAMETTWWKGAILLTGTLVAFALNRSFLKWRVPGRAHGARPYDFFLHKGSLAVTAVLIALMALLSIFGFLVRSRGKTWHKASVGALIVVSLTMLYSFNTGFLDTRGRLTLDHIYYRSLFGAYFVQGAFGDLAQDDQARERFHRLPKAEMDYDILIALNDTQRWDHLSTNGFPRPTDDAIEWLVRKSFNFKFPISPSNSTDTAVPALLTGLASDRDVKQIKGALALWDYFSKGAETFFISSQDVTWAKLHLYYASIGQKHVWSATAQPGYRGNPEDTNDISSAERMKQYVPRLKQPWVGVWQTFASHFPYTVNPGFDRYRPCDLDRSDVEKFRNCYLNAQVYSSVLRDEVFKTLDLDRTVIVMTSDHGEGLGEHGIFFHGADFHQEIVKVPFILYIPEKLLAKLPAAAVANLRGNVGRVISTTDLVPTLLDLHRMLMGQKLVEDGTPFTGRSLFTKWDYRVVFSSYCFPQYRCYSREILFADDEYYVIFRPSEGFHAIYETWKDLEQKNPLTLDRVDRAKFRRLIDGAARVHPSGEAMKLYYEGLTSAGED